jgi:hypothetical protein
VNDDGTMGEIKFANWRAWRIIQNIDSLVDVSLQEDDRNKWKETISMYREVIEVRAYLSMFK